VIQIEMRWPTRETRLAVAVTALCGLAFGCVGRRSRVADEVNFDADMALFAGVVRVFVDSTPGPIRVDPRVGGPAEQDDAGRLGGSMRRVWSRCAVGCLPATALRPPSRRSPKAVPRCLRQGARPHRAPRLLAGTRRIHRDRIATLNDPSWAGAVAFLSGIPVWPPLRTRRRRRRTCPSIVR